MSKIVASASTLLARSEEANLVYLVHRPASHRSFPDTHVFPGGKVDETDGKLPFVGSYDPSLSSAYGAAARELFEETGVLLSRPLPAPERRAEVEALREVLDQGKVPFAEVLRRLEVKLDADRLIPLGEKTTPPFAQLRFRNRFFMVYLPPGQEPVFGAGEHDAGDWVAADEAVARFEAGSMNLAPPVLLLLEAWGKEPAREASRILAGFSDATFADRAARIRFSPQVILFPGKTPTLPPATCTNTYIVGQDRLLVVDPATDDPVDREKLAGLLEELLAEGRRIEALVLTHHHEDHVGAVHFLHERFGAPVWAHPATFDRLPGYPRDRSLRDGDTIDLGEGGRIAVLHTPGHARGHVCLHQERFGALIAGDMISTLSTIVIDPPEGDMTDYLLSLERLSRLPATVLYPAHGPPAPQPPVVLAKYIAHRRQREDKLVTALGGEGRGPQDLDQLVTVVYDDVPPEVHPIAKRSLLAGLQKLEREGRARSAGGTGWVAAGGAD